MTTLAFQPNDSSFLFGDHRIRLVRHFTTEAGTVEDIGFVASDLAKALEIQRTNDVTSRLDPDQKGADQIRTPGGTQSMTVISESGFYDVVVRSDKPQGKDLRAVVTREILPAIRRTGQYALGEQSTSPAPVALPVDVLATVEKSIDLLERLGGIDDRAELLFKDIILNNAARAAGGSITALPAVQMLSLQEALQQFGDATPQEASKLAREFGMIVKKTYKKENGRPPKTHKQLVNGRGCDVCDYEIEWIRDHADDLKNVVLYYRAR